MDSTWSIEKPPSSEFYVCWASWRPMSKALYSATLLEQGFVSENARGRTWLSGKTNITPTPVIIFPFELVLDAPSKNICHTSLLEVMLALITSSVISSCGFEVSETGWAAKKFARAWPLMAFWGMKVKSYWDSSMAQLANLEFRELGFVIRIHRGLTLEMT